MTVGFFNRPCFAWTGPSFAPLPPTAIAIPSPRGPCVFLIISSWPSLTIWQRACVECGALFEIATPSEAGADDPAFETFTCQAHRETSP
jgi:hypothetical protein